VDQPAPSSDHSPSVLPSSKIPKYRRSGNLVKLVKPNPAPEKTVSRQISVGFLDNDILLENFLTFHLAFPANLIEKLIRLKKIRLERNGKRVPLSSGKLNVKEGDVVFVHHWAKDVARPDAKSLVLHPPVLEEDKDSILDTVLYKDEDIIVINKPNDIAVHGGTKTPLHLQRFLDALRFDATSKPYFVHRLDKKTSGALILARSKTAARKLSLAFRQAADPVTLHREKLSPSLDAFGNLIQFDETSEPAPSNPMDLDIVKIYWAILTGVPAGETSGLIDRHLYISPETGVNISDDYSIDTLQQEREPRAVPTDTRIQIRHPDRTSPYHNHCLKRAITEYQVIETIGKKGSWVRLLPQTGRKHQLRVHTASVLKSPILGDTKYGIKSYRQLHDLGWGQHLDLTRLTGIKGRSDGMPMFLHLRQIVIKNYYRHLGAGGRGFAKSTDDDYDLVVTAPISDDWKQLMKSCGLSYSKRF
jgi:23S rRNA pseudouridine955/2504/2580 synthase